MAYNLPPISTLSAVLGDATQSELQIAPELLNDPSEQTSGQASGSNHQPTSDQHQQWTTDHHYQVDESSDHLGWIDGAHGVEGNGHEGDQQPPRKKKKRGAVNNGDIANILNEATVADYEDPGGDWRAGVVYVHPPSTSNQACVRCHRIKRKCDNGRPRCSGCWKSGTPCVFEISPATAGFVTHLKNEQFNTATQLQEAQQRVAELEAQLASSSSIPSNGQGNGTNSGDDHVLSSVDTTSPFNNPPAAEVDNYYTGFAQTILGMSNQTELNPAQTRSSGAEGLPSLDVAQTAASAFFDEYDLLFPYLRRREFMADLQDLWGSRSAGDREVFAIMMITSVGAFVGEAAGTIDAGTSQSLRQRAMRNLGKATSQVDLTAVQAYLALFSSVQLGLHPDISLTDVLALAMQTALSLELHRAQTATPAANNELRKRIWWTIYNHDRSLATCLGRPLGIAEFDGDVHLPMIQSSDDSDWFNHLEGISLQRRRLAQIHTCLYSTDIYDAWRDTELGLEDEMKRWYERWPSSQEGKASWLYLQAVLMIYRPGRGRIDRDDEQIDKLDRTLTDSISILQDVKPQQPTTVPGLAWRFQVAITMLYRAHERPSQDPKEQVEVSRKLLDVPGYSLLLGTKCAELVKLKSVYDEMVDCLLNTPPNDMREAVPNTYLRLFQPMVQSANDKALPEESSQLPTGSANSSSRASHFDRLV